MPSLKSKIFNSLMRNRHLFQGKLKREVFDFDTSIENFRALCEKGAAKNEKIPANIVIKEDTVNGIHAEWIIPEGADLKQVISPAISYSPANRPEVVWLWRCFCH